MSEQSSVNRPPDTITLDGHKYVSEYALALWGTIEVMVRNPAVAERIADLEARLEKAEAERDGYSPGSYAGHESFDLCKALKDKS